jgi:N-acetylmuramoyl-L-alanine amidase
MGQVLLPGLALGVSVAIVSPALANDGITLVYPPEDHQTTAHQIFFIGTADPDQPVLLNGEPIEPRSASGHFAPSLPLELGPNPFTLTQGDETITLTITRVAPGPTLPDTLGFAEGSLSPGVDLARQPGDLICLGAIARPNATVTAALAGETYTLLPQAGQRQLPPNYAVLTDQVDPWVTEGPQAYEACFPATATGALGRPTYRLSYQGESITAQATGEVNILAPDAFEIATVTVPAGVARTGPSTSYSRLTPLPQGTQAAITGRDGDWLRLDYGGWIRAAETEIRTGGGPARSQIRGISSRQVAGWTEILFPLQVPVPVTVNQSLDTLSLTLHNTTAQTDTIFVGRDPAIERLDWYPTQPGQAQYQVRLRGQQPWGYQLRYDDTTLVLAIKHPPEQQGDRPLAGTTILVDPGHGGEELGARGPDGTPEKDVALDLSLWLQTALESRGATVIMTRTDDSESGPNARAEQINQDQPTLALSIHYNALPDDGDALNTAGVGAFWFHAQAQPVAQFLHDYLVDQLDRPSYGVFWNNLALTRPHVAPSVLLEIGFMINPFEFEWIMDTEAQQQVAEVLADGVAEWVSQTRGTD